MGGGRTRIQTSTMMTAPDTDLTVPEMHRSERQRLVRSLIWSPIAPPLTGSHPAQRRAGWMDAARVEPRAIPLDLSTL